MSSFSADLGVLVAIVGCVLLTIVLHYKHVRPITDQIGERKFEDGLEWVKVFSPVNCFVPRVIWMPLPPKIPPPLTFEEFMKEHSNEHISS